MLDIFNNNAFSVVELSQAINIVPNKYGRLQEMNLMPGKPVRTTTIYIENNNGVLTLLPSKPRGADGSKGANGKRTLLSFVVPHFPHEDVIKAEDVQGVRSFGTEDQMQTVQDVVNDKLITMRSKHDITLEFLRMGALNGLILDADGSTLYNLYTEFGITEEVVNFDFAGVPNVEGSCRSVLRHIEDNLLGDVMTGVNALVSPEFFDSLTADTAVKDAYKYHASTADPLRQDPRKGFFHQGIMFEEYRGQASYSATDGTTVTRKFIAAGEARFFPVGTHNTYQTNFAPADFMESVNTLGMEVYAKQERMKFDRGIDLHTQSNPLPMCARPAVQVKGTSA